MDWIRNIFRREAASPPNQPGNDALALQSEAQRLRMELQARDERIVELKQEIERLQARQDNLVAEVVSVRIADLLGDLAGPVSQIQTQANLLEVQEKPVQARDVLAVAKRVVRAVERHGVVFEGKIGEQIPFDPNRHAPISAGSNLSVGQPVTVRFAGVTYQGKLLYKAVVE
jgi:molecular chaperone GrpE (heat shock protein)